MKYQLDTRPGVREAACWCFTSLKHLRTYQQILIELRLGAGDRGKKTPSFQPNIIALFAYQHNHGGFNLFLAGSVDLLILVNWTNINRSYHSALIIVKFTFREGLIVPRAWNQIPDRTQWLGWQSAHFPCGRFVVCFFQMFPQPVSGHIRTSTHRWQRTLTVTLCHWDTWLPALSSQIPLSHIILTLRNPVFVLS